MKFSTMVVFMILWGTAGVLPVVPLGLGRRRLGLWLAACEAVCVGGALDFAGGTVVHISSGVSALIWRWCIGKRLGYRPEPMPPHNLTYTALGPGCCGWVGSDSMPAARWRPTASPPVPLPPRIFRRRPAPWPGPRMEWMMGGKPTVLGACSGAVAGLVCITPASGYVLPMPALLMGAAAGIVCCLPATVLKPKFGYDDSLDAFGVHGMGGTLGAILTGVFATRAVQDLNSGDVIGLYEGASC